MTDHPQSFFSRAGISGVVFFTLFIFLLFQVGRLIAPLLTPLLWAGILALALRPIYLRLLARVKERHGLAAGVMTAATLFLIVGPAVTLTLALTSQAVDLYHWTASRVQSGAITELWDRVTASSIDKLLSIPGLSDIDIKGMAIKSIGDFSSGLAGRIGGLVKNVVVFVIDIAIMLVALFFFFRDGDAYYRTFIDLLPFSKRNKDAIAQKISETFSAVINGVFLIALLQGIMTGLGFFLFRIPFAIFWGFLATLAALLPVGGAALVWVPGAVYLYLTGATVKAVLLAVWGMVFVSLPDNFLKPLIIGRKAKIPTFILFIALLGGLQTFGFLGILLGPIVITLATAFIQIYHEEFAG